MQAPGQRDEVPPVSKDPLVTLRECHQMPGEEGIILLVEEVGELGSARNSDGDHALVECENVGRYAYGMLDSWPLGVLYALAGSEVHRLEDPSLGLTHMQRRGWFWHTDSPGIYPSAPFLLTNLPGFKCIYHGEVSVSPSDDAVEVFQGCEEYGDGLGFPVVEKEWLGFLELEAVTARAGLLTAFSPCLARLPDRIATVLIADAYVELGNLRLPG